MIFYGIFYKILFLYSTFNGRQHKTSDVRAERHGFPLVLELHDLQGKNDDLTILCSIFLFFWRQDCVAHIHW